MIVYAAVRYTRKDLGYKYEGVPVNWLSDDSETSKTFVLFPPNWEDTKFYEKARKEAAEPQADYIVARHLRKNKKAERLGNIGKKESEMEGTGVIAGRKRRATAGIWYSQEPESSEDDVSDSSGSHEAIVQEADSSTPESSPRGRGIKKKARRIHPAAPKLNVPPSNLSTNFRQSNSSPIRINTSNEPLPAAEFEFTSPAVRPVASCSKSPSSSVPNVIETPARSRVAIRIKHPNASSQAVKYKISRYFTAMRAKSARVNSEQHMPFVYSVWLKNPAVEIATMVSERQRTIDIRNWLQSLVIAFGPQHTPEAVVCDFSAALLNGVSQAFCGISLKEYLERCYQHLEGHNAEIRSFILTEDAHLQEDAYLREDAQDEPF
ncbi:unnamed protein product [Cyprideis torosa]|uniref:Uncharacterized protein n=1 Tax=Cyprideis torosa TaxID=163714 RepID=A0A7R8WGW7_9CRUS|nr:unnamed protein product [Cyprideis torosa]CAG0898688.1 unnamed protein product [Cyprideis torosa]